MSKVFDDYFSRLAIERRAKYGRKKLNEYDRRCLQGLEKHDEAVRQQMEQDVQKAEQEYSQMKGTLNEHDQRV